ncbi:MAG: ribosomal-processing cysteine protease Prp [Lachnospiraceae bacterium]|nr:ribosomal-processing cysteine protease Prp [Lachnospiraceae bacterium]
MIRARVSKDQEGNYVSFSCKGHAEYSDKGNDIVCAAVSILVINTANAIEKLTDNRILGTQDEDIKMEFPEGLDEKGVLLMDAMILGLKQIAEKYFSNVDLIIEEV